MVRVAAVRIWRSLNGHIHRKVVFTRPYNGQANGPHTTYFQPPSQPPKPPRKILRTALFGTACLLLGGYVHSWVYNSMLPFEDMEELLNEEAHERLTEHMAAASQDLAARKVPSLNLQRAQDLLQLRSGFSMSFSTITHTCQLPSNLPCEDTLGLGSYTVLNDLTKDWCSWSIFDGHAGPRTSHLLKEFFPSILGKGLWDAQCMERPYTPDDPHIIQTIKNIFMQTDKDILDDAADRVKLGVVSPLSVSIASAALSGSCALVSIFDPLNSVLRVANTGDSRAVLGRWSSSENRYIAIPMSKDQTGFNQDEVERLQREHPGENPVDSETGRVFGIAVSRAFGDSRWKWPNHLTQLAHEKFWGPKPRPNGAVQTPPYLTSEPEVVETKIQVGEKPDFLIMASDGLWDNISSDDAVTCVQQWLDKNKSPDMIAEYMSDETVHRPFANQDSQPAGPVADIESVEDDDTYYDPKEEAMKWRVCPKYFINEDDNCGMHLVKNALGGNRRNLYLSVMSIQPPLSRSVRDDITVHVVFFGIDTSRARQLYGQIAEFR